MELKLDASVPALSDELIKSAKKAEEVGFDCVWTNENSNDGFLPHPLIAEHTTSIQHGTRIALSFTRSPMVLAYKVWDLARYSNGRFILGLGTQVKGHNERRFSTEWKSPGPRLREVIESIRHIWDVFQKEESTLDYQGDHYSFSLMTDAFDPGPIDNPTIPIYIAAVNEYNIQLAGEICDGLAVHVFNTPSYTKNVILPFLQKGADSGNRSINDVSVSISPFIITGNSPEEIKQHREETRSRIAFYGSTRTYHDILEHHGWGDIGKDLHDLSRDGKWNEMSDLISNDMLYTFAIEEDPESLLDEVYDQYGDIADRILLPLEYADEYKME